MSFRATLRQFIPSRRARSWPVLAGTAATALAFAAAGDAVPEWRAEASLSLARTEVAAAVVGGRIAVAGGFLEDGSSSRRVDLYEPGSQSWRRLPDLPVGLNHAMAAAHRGRLYVVGGYLGQGRVFRGGYVFANGRWRALPRMPEPRAAAGAAVAAGKLYVVGGVAAPGNLARRALVLDLARLRWTSAPGPQPREHLAAAAVGGKVYALAGRLAGIDTNLAVLESYTPGSRALGCPAAGAAPARRHRRRGDRTRAGLDRRRGAGRHGRERLRVRRRPSRVASAPGPPHSAPRPRRRDAERSRVGAGRRRAPGLFVSVTAESLSPR